MPRYDYLCEECNVATTITRGIYETDNPNCEVCKHPLKRVYSSIGVTFNGSGFYSTDK